MPVHQSAGNRRKTPVTVGRYERKPYEVSGYLQGTVEHFLLYRDTDIHLTARASGSRPGALGIALSRNLAPHFEARAERQNDWRLELRARYSF